MPRIRHASFSLRLAVLALAAPPAALMAQSGATGAAQPLTPARVYADPDLSGPRARAVKLAPDGTLVTWLRAKADDQRMTDLWAADMKGGEPRLLVDGRKLIPQARALSEAEIARRERQGTQSRGVVDYAWDEQGRFLLVPVEGDLWLWSRADGSLRRLTATTADEIDAKVSPRGSYVSFVRDDNLYLQPVAGGPERALTGDGSELQSWATAEFIAQEELDRDTGYWWSPDERRIALAHVDTRGVDVVPRPDIGAAGATIVSQRYPRAGRPNAVVELWLARVDGGERVKVDLGPDPDIYLARVDWAKDGRTLYVQRLTRDQKRLDLLAVDPATGAARVVQTQASPHWVELSHDFTPLESGNFLWSSEATGHRHLALFARDGKLIRQLTRGDWPVSALLGVDEARRRVLFAASMDSPVERRIYAIRYDRDGQPLALTPGGGWWTASVAKKGGAFAATYADPDTPPATALHAPDGRRLRWIEENRLGPDHPWWPFRDRYPAPRYGTIKAADGQDLWWSMQLPVGFDPARRWPVIVRIYGGPAGALVNKGWVSPADRLYLEAGYILFTLDNRGTPNRSVAFKTAIDRRMGQAEVADQLAGAAFLKAQPYVDPTRLGATGWSNGGYMTLLLLSEPDTPFAAGVAGAPPTDWSLYDTGYTERYMGKPQDNPAGYAASEVTARLDRIRPGSLMLVHGMADDNVTFDNSTRVMAALQSRGIAFETMLYPGLRHRAGWSQAQLRHRTEATLAFFERKLGGGGR